MIRHPNSFDHIVCFLTREAFSVGKREKWKTQNEGLICGVVTGNSSENGSDFNSVTHP